MKTLINLINKSAVFGAKSLVVNLRRNNMNDEYEDAIAWADVTECDYLQQGNQGDISSYTLDELIGELNV